MTRGFEAMLKVLKSLEILLHVTAVHDAEDIQLALDSQDILALLVTWGYLCIISKTVQD